MRKVKKMCIEWKDNKAVIGKSGDLLLARRSLETSPSEVLLEDGYLENGVSHYYIRDHLGNNRVVASSGGSIIQKNYYYPFGMSYADDVAPAKQPYKYNGKELDSMNGLNQYDYSARFHDPAVGRFMTMDPLAELRPHESPYSFCGNNPVNATDEDGRFWNYVIGGAIGGVVEYGSQVVGNMVKDGEVSLSAFTKDIDLVDIGVAMAEGALTSGGSAIKSVAAKTAVKVVSSVVQNTVDGTVEKGIETEKSATNVVKKTAMDMAGDAAGKALPKSNVKVAKETTGNKAVNSAREKATARGETLSKVDADKARNSVPAKNNTARGINKTLSETPGNAAGNAAAEAAKRKLEDEKK